MTTNILPDVNTKTVAGAEYVRKVTHPPPASESNSYHGRPDSSSGNVVLFELKGETNVPMVLVKATGPSTSIAVNPGRALLLSGSGQFCASYLFFFDNGVWTQPQSNPVASATLPLMHQIAPPACLNSGYNFNNWRTDVAAHRTTYKSQTCYLNATGFNNQGTVTSAKFKPDILVADSSTFITKITDPELFRFLDAFLNIAPTDFRTMHAAMLARKNGLGEEYVHVGSQKLNAIDIRKLFNTFSYNFQFLILGTGTGTISPLVNSVMYSLNGVMPETMGDLLMSSPKAVTRPAIEGDFLVHQQINDICSWTDNVDPSPIGSSQVPGLVFTFLRYTNISAGAQYAPLYSIGQVSLPGGNSWAVDTQWNNLDWGYTMFDGLTVPTALSTSLTGGPYLTVKTFVGYEVQPQPFSSLLPFQKSLPLPDPTAIEMAVGIMHARPDSLPASANDLASIASVALKMLPTAVSWLKDLFGNDKSKGKAMNKARDFVRPRKPVRDTRTSFPVATTTAPSYTNQPIEYQRPRRAPSTQRRGPAPAARLVSQVVQGLGNLNLRSRSMPRAPANAAARARSASRPRVTLAPKPRR